MTLSLRPISMKASMARSTSASEWAAESWTRIRALPVRKQTRIQHKPANKSTVNSNSQEIYSPHMYFHTDWEIRECIAIS